MKKSIWILAFLMGCAEGGGKSCGPVEATDRLREVQERQTALMTRQVEALERINKALYLCIPAEKK